MRLLGARAHPLQFSGSGCMEDSSGAAVCPQCGWLAGQEAESPLYLPPGTILPDQFVVGRVLGHGGFGISYLAWA